MMNGTVLTHRSGQLDTLPTIPCSYTLVVLVADRLEIVDRIIGLFLQQRADVQSLTLVPSSMAHVARITAVVDASQVVVDHLVEQIRKVIDILEVILLPSRQTEALQPQLLTTSMGAFHCDREQLHHAAPAHETVSLEVIDSAGKIYTFVGRLVMDGFYEALSQASHRDMLSRGEVGAD